MVYRKAKFFRICIYTKHGGGALLPPLCVSVSLWQTGAFHWPAIRSLRRSPCGDPVCPIAAQSLWCNNPQRHRISSRSEETTPLPSVSKTNERTSGTVRRRSRFTPIQSGLQVDRFGFHVLTNPEQTGFRVCTYKP